MNKADVCGLSVLWVAKMQTFQGLLLWYFCLIETFQVCHFISFFLFWTRLKYILLYFKQRQVGLVWLLEDSTVDECNCPFSWFHFLQLSFALLIPLEVSVLNLKCSSVYILNLRKVIPADDYLSLQLECSVYFTHFLIPWSQKHLTEGFRKCLYWCCQILTIWIC